MPSHAPPNYTCPFCLLAQGQFSHPALLTRHEDIVLETPTLLAFISAHAWPNNPGHLLIIPRAHHENLYTLPVDLGAEIFAASQRLARAMKLAYGCPGTSTRQHNEPAGNQDVWHYHLHLFPRYENDRLYHLSPHPAHPETRAAQAAQAAQLRTALPPTEERGHTSF